MTSRPSFMDEKDSVLGELAVRMKKLSTDGCKQTRGDADAEDFPPPPPVFQTYAAQLCGQHEEDEEDLPPPPPPPPQPAPPAVEGLKTPSRTTSPQKTTTLLNSGPRPYKPPSSTYISPSPDAGTRPKTPPSPPPKSWLPKSSTCDSRKSPTGASPRSVSSSSLLPSPSPSPVPPPRKDSSSSTSRRDSTSSSASTERRGNWSISPSHASATGLTSERKEPIAENGRKMSHGEVGRGKISLEGQRANDSNSWKASQEKNGRKMSKEFDGRKLSQEVNGGRKLSQDLKVGRKVSHEVLGGRKMSQDLDGMEGTEVLAVLNLPSKNCFACGKPVLPEEGCSALGRTYHQTCFCCSGCGVQLERKFFTHDELPVCEDCYKEPAEECGRCGEKIVGDCLLSGDTHYHHHCMKCAVCEEGLRGTYFTYMDQLICEKCYRETQKQCSECGEVIAGTYYTLDNDKIVCEADYRKQLGNCQKCGLVVEGRIMKVSGMLFHPDCFTCSVCQKNMVGIPFSLGEDKQIYCAEDYQKKHAATCSACGEAILPKPGESSAPRLRALGKDFHPLCFKCQDCSVVLDSRVPGSECYPLGQVPLCGICHRGRQR